MSNSKYLTFFLTLFTLMAFAANSIFCRLALKLHSIGALEFTTIRLFSGLVILLPIIAFYKRNTGDVKLTVNRPNLASALALFAYALFFSLAYIKLDASIGALILFASVQITMVGISIYRGNRLSTFEWLGFVLAFAGLIYLVLPGLSAPPLVGAIMMLISGASWGVYSLIGKSEKYPVFSTARNFLFCAPGILLLMLLITANTVNNHQAMSPRGLFLAVLSGSMTSGLGYVLWYVTLKRISTTVASIVQLAVPVLAGLGGVLVLSENLSLRLLTASAFIFGGIFVTIAGRRRILVGSPNLN